MPWQSVPRANFMFLHAARLQAHYAAQWLSRAARAYVPAEPHDRHTSLGWDDAFRLPKEFCPGDAGAMTKADAVIFTSPSVCRCSPVVRK